MFLKLIFLQIIKNWNQMKKIMNLCYKKRNFINCSNTSVTVYKHDFDDIPIKSNGIKRFEDLLE